MPKQQLLPAIDSILKAIRRKQSLEDILGLIIEKACDLAHAVHGSFVLVDHESGQLTISTFFGSDWTLKEKLCQLKIGEGLTGKVAATGQPLLCNDTRLDPDYFPLFDYVRSELVVPVMVADRVWGVINIDGESINAFDARTLELLTVFAELAASAITLQIEIADQERLYRKLIQSEKLASLGEALAGVAHELNNPLTSILGFSSLLSHAPGLSERDQRAATVIANESKRAATLIRGLLDFSRKETGAREQIDAGQLVQKAVELRRFQSRDGAVTLEVVNPDTPCPVEVCSQQITQVLHNLITNAEQAMPADRPDGKIRITLERKASLIRVAVSDNGTGIPADVQDKIFDPFFTTKAPGVGTGLGLSICHTIMVAHGGSIYVAETSPAGTTFVLEMPLAENAALKADSYPPFGLTAGSPALSLGRVLIVDDEPNISEAFAYYLSQKQIVVARAAGATEALRLLATEDFDIILSDIRMPVMDGLEFHETVCRQHPRYRRRFIFMSGYLLHTRVKAHLETTGLPYLEKPFSFDELLRTVTKHLTLVGEMAATG